MAGREVPVLQVSYEYPDKFQADSAFPLTARVGRIARLSFWRSPVY